MPLYTVFVDDNFHYMDESERYEHGKFSDCQSAIAACRWIVDRSLAELDLDATPDALFAQYTMFGEDPWIRSDDGDCRFSARAYARERCYELATRRVL